MSRELPFQPVATDELYGDAIQKLGDREELLGADLIVPHRMLKNHVIEKTGIQIFNKILDWKPFE